MKTQTEAHFTRSILTVSQLTAKVKSLLEDKFAIVWITGEICDCRIPSSGHAYCTLKDSKAQIPAVMFKGQLRQLKFELQDGLDVVGMGRITVYEPRGTYQIILEYVEPRGAGAIQIAFEQLKLKLQQEGLFDEGHKRPIPYLPAKIGVITSPTGAVIRDILHVLERRFRVPVDIYPVRVQGDGAENDIAKAIALANRRADAEVLILARGGGSLEDMAAFNSETVARAIFASQIPVISAVGHETDFSIADFVADLRAPTPSAAAEMAVPVRSEVNYRCLELRQRCERAMRRIVTLRRENMDTIRRSLVHPRYKVQQLQLRLDDMVQKIIRGAAGLINLQRNRLGVLEYSLFSRNPRSYVLSCQSRLALMDFKLAKSLTDLLTGSRGRLAGAISAMRALDPKAVLSRGYSITRKLPDGQLLADARDAFPGLVLEIILSNGEVVASVLETRAPAAPGNNAKQ